MYRLDEPEMVYVRFEKGQQYSEANGVIIPRHLITNLDMSFSAYVIYTEYEKPDGRTWVATDIKFVASEEISHRGKTSLVDHMIDSISTFDMNFIPVGYYTDIKRGLDISIVCINVDMDYSDIFVVSDDQFFMTRIDVCHASGDIEYVEISADPKLTRLCADAIVSVIKSESERESFVAIDTTDNHYSEVFLDSIVSFIATDKFVCTKYEEEDGYSYGLCYRVKDLNGGEYKQVYLYSVGEIPEPVLALERVYTGLLAAGYTEIIK